MASEESATDAGHHPPADEDWPRGFGEASVWPGVTAVGVTAIYVGVAAYLLSRGAEPLVPALLAVVLLIPGLGLFLAGLYGWTYHGFVSRYWLRSGGEATALRWGMLVFLVTDVATFGAGFVYYFFIRTGAWPPHELPHLLSSLVLVNTALLVTSSVTMHLADVSIRADRRRRFLLALGTTLGLGLLFVGGQVLEYAAFLGEAGLDPTSIFFSGFFALTGLHGLHVALGVVLLGVVFVRALRGQFSAERHTAVATVSMYWHFVDVVWLFLVVTLYVGAAA